MILALEILVTLFKVAYSLLESLILSILPLKVRRAKSVAGEVALVTGAGSGIGRLVSIRLARLGAKLVLWDINQEGLEETRRLIDAEGGQAWAYECNVTDRYLVYLMAERVREEVGHVSILVNNAGVVSGQPFLDTPDEKIQLTMDVNVMAHFWVRILSGKKKPSRKSKLRNLIVH